MRRRGLMAALLVLLACAGCGTVVDGSGTAGPSVSRSRPSSDGSSGSSGPSTPETSTPSTPDTSSGPVGPTSSPTTSPPSAVALNPMCPNPKAGAAYLTYTCITSPMVGRIGGNPWYMVQTQTVEPSTRWAVQTGVSSPVAGTDLQAAASKFRTAMITLGNYGDSPSYKAVSRTTRIANRPAILMDATITLNPAWAAKAKTKVRQERLWIAAVQVGSNRIGVWHVTIPDIAKSLWARVPQAVASIKIT